MGYNSSATLFYGIVIGDEQDDEDYPKALRGKDVDEVFKGSEEWYAIVARSRPPKDRPWYHVLVHDSSDRTYVAERNLEPDKSDEPINHPEIYDFFSDLVEGLYLPKSIN